MKTFIHDFEVVGSEGKKFVVEAECIFYKGYPNPDSDWEVKDFIEIIEIKVFDNGVRTGVHVSEDLVLSSLKKSLHKVEVDLMFGEESGGF